MKFALNWETIERLGIPMHRIIASFTLAAGFVLTVAPAFAQVQVPEPASMSLLGVGIAGAYIATRIRRKKSKD